MKIKICLFLLAILLFTHSGIAQNASTSTFQVKGVVLDSLTKEGEPYATIKVAKKEKPDITVKMFVTNLQGKFNEKIPITGNFVITISAVGRKTIVKAFTSNIGDKTIDLGIIYITDASHELGQIEVVAQKPLVKADVDKIAYNVQDDPDSKSNSVLEMLRKVPLVTVDGEDNIKVNGNSSFKVYVNGKPNNMMSNNPTEVLKSMPANSIKHIEVITNPGSKYDAEGVGGILNIVTIGSGLEGYTVTVSGNVSNNGVGGGTFGTVKSGKLTLSGRYNYSYYNSPRSYSGGNRQATGDINASSSNLNYEGNNKGHGQYQSGSMEASYDIDTLRLVSISFGLWGGGNNSNGLMNYQATRPQQGTELYRYGMSNKSKSSWYSIDGSVDYQRLFKLKGRMLTLSYKINTSPQSSDTYSYYLEKQGEVDWQDFLKRLQDQHNDGSQNTTENTFQMDYTTPIGKIHNIETGAKYILRNNTSENDRYLQENPEDVYEFDGDHSSHYRHLNNILAGYASYSLKIKKFSGKMGVRYEHTRQDVKFLLGHGENFKKNLDDIVPSVSLGWKLTEMSNFLLAYDMRIYRPNIWYLNPYLNDSNPSNISQGNPDLNTEKNHSFNLSYSNFTQKLSVNISFRYSFTNNSIEQISTILPDNKIPGLSNPTGKEVLYTTYENIGKSKFANLNGYINWNMTSSTRIYTNFYGNYADMRGANGLKNNGWSLYDYCGEQQTLPHDWRISLNIYGQTPWTMLQGRSSSFFDYGMSVNKSFISKRLTLSAFANNFFKKYIRNTSTLEGTGFTQENWNKYTRQRFGISISYRIGELKASVKKAARSISNDDVKSSGSSSGSNSSSE